MELLFAMSYYAEFSSQKNQMYTANVGLLIFYRRCPYVCTHTYMRICTYEFFTLHVCMHGYTQNKK